MDGITFRRARWFYRFAALGSYLLQRLLHLPGCAILGSGFRGSGFQVLTCQVQRRPIMLHQRVKLNGNLLIMYLFIPQLVDSIVNKIWMCQRHHGVETLLSISQSDILAGHIVSRLDAYKIKQVTIRMITAKQVLDIILRHPMPKVSYP